MMALALVRHEVQGARILGPFFLDSCLINSTAYGLVEWHRAKKGPGPGLNYATAT